MRIISKYKDYYDYLTGIYGIDNNLVLDRREGFVLNNYDFTHSDPKEVQVQTFAICDKIYNMFYDYKGKFITIDDILMSGEVVDFGDSLMYKGRRIYLEDVPTNLNIKHNCPIIYIRYDRDVEEFPMLKNTGIPSIIPAEKMFMDLSNWLSKQKDVDRPDNQTDKEKIKSHGFDIKKSFRHRK